MQSNCAPATAEGSSEGKQATQLTIDENSMAYSI